MKFWFVFALLICTNAFAFENFQLAPYVGTTFPIFLGGGVSATVHDNYEISLGYGFAPEPYYKVIGSVAAELGGNSAYKDVIEAGFQDNSIIKGNFQYNFSNASSGWHAGSSVLMLESSGQAGIDTVLAAATGKDYTTLKNLLTAAGRNTEVDMDSDLLIVEIYGGYKWALEKNFVANLNIGIAKVMESSVKLKTGLPAFESSASGSALLRSTESDLEGILSDYGISPTIAGDLTYLF